MTDLNDHHKPQIAHPSVMLVTPMTELEMTCKSQQEHDDFVFDCVMLGYAIWCTGPVTYVFTGEVGQ